jgi:hypothetical protein
VHRNRKLTIAEIDQRTLDDVTPFVDDKTGASALMKERQPPALIVITDAVLTRARDHSFAHPNLNDVGSTPSPWPMIAAFEAEAALFKLDYGHRQNAAALLNFQCPPFISSVREICARKNE